MKVRGSSKEVAIGDKYQVEECYDDFSKGSIMEASESTNASNDHVAFWGYPISASKHPKCLPSPWCHFDHIVGRPRSSRGLVETNHLSEALVQPVFANCFMAKKDVQMNPNAPFCILFHIFIPGFHMFSLVFTLALYHPDVRRCAMRKIYVRGTKTWFPNEPMKHQVDSPQYHLGHTTQDWKAFQILSKSHCMLDSNVWQ